MPCALVSRSRQAGDGVGQPHDDGGAVGVARRRRGVERDRLAAAREREAAEHGEAGGGGDAPQPAARQGGDSVGHPVQATVSGMERAARPGDPTIAELGESAVLGRILPRLAPGDAALLGPGDDAAVVAAADGRFVVTTDLLVHGPDFRLAWSTPFDLGWKAAATNLTDVAAMGARPTALVVAIAAPPVDARDGARGHRRRAARGARGARARAPAWSAATSRPRRC